MWIIRLSVLGAGLTDYVYQSIVPRWQGRSVYIQDQVT